MKPEMSVIGRFGPAVRAKIIETETELWLVAKVSDLNMSNNSDDPLPFYAPDRKPDPPKARQRASEYGR